MAELNLKIITFGIYYEQLLFNLKSGLQDALHLIALDMKAVWAKLQEAPPEKSNSCPICEQTLLHQSYVRKHVHISSVTSLNAQFVMRLSNLHMSCQLTLKNITRTKMLAVIPILTLENLPPPSVGTLSLTIYTCDLCGKQSETNDRLLKHIETCHGDTFCSDSKLNSEHLPNDGAATINHNDVNHGFKYLYTCYKCDETFATHNLLASHVQTFH